MKSRKVRTLGFSYSVFYSLLLFLLVTNVIYTQEQKQFEKRFEGIYKEEVELNYLLYFPKDYSEDKSFPLLLFLHGAGERGNDLNLVKKHGPSKLIEEGKDFPFVVASPQCPTDKRWNTKALIALIDEIISNYKIDEDRIYVTGLSMGGNGTWRLATEIANRLAAIIPICGWGDPFDICSIGNLPVWTFHGAKDFIVPVTSSQVLVDRLKYCKGNAKITIYPEAGHDSWTETYNNPEIYEWLLSHSKSQR
ncbi:MAG: dienelactone hydrolase family protein [Melioribacteraceae bacterium]|nr:dienelactone hydrolase family protein [Melioribacteraceae bacterium]